jgi:hypothetical protein
MENNSRGYAEYSIDNYLDQQAGFRTMLRFADYNYPATLIFAVDRAVKN